MFIFVGCNGYPVPVDQLCLSIPHGSTHVVFGCLLPFLCIRCDQ